MSDASSGAPRPGHLGRGYISALGVALICSWGSLYYSFPQIAEAVGSEFGWSKTELYGAATLGLVLSSLAAYPVGAAIDRGHGRVVMAGASVLAGLAMVAWSRIDTLPGFYAAFAAVGLLQAATLYEAAFATVVRRAGPDGARHGITSLTLWGGFASTVFIPLIQFLLDTVGWRGALMALGGVNIFICAGLYFTAIRPERDIATTHAEPDPPASLLRNPAVLEAMRLPVFWALLLCFLAYAAMFSAFTFHIYPMLLEKGFTAIDAVTVIALIGPSQVAGRIAITFFAREASIAAIGCVTVAIMTAVFAAAAYGPSSFVFMAAIAVGYGATNGIMTIVRGMAVPTLVSKRAYGAINGALIGPYMLALAFAPMAIAWLRQSTGGYDAVQVALAALAAIVALSFWAAVLLRPRGGPVENRA